MAITPLKIEVADDTSSRIAQELRRQFNALIDEIAALDDGTATAGDIVLALQKAKKVVVARELPQPPQFPTP